MGMMDHLMTMGVVIPMIFDPDELGRELAPFYDGVLDAAGIRSAVGSWVLHEQMESGHRVGWVPRAVGLMYRTACVPPFCPGSGLVSSRVLLYVHPPQRRGRRQDGGDDRCATIPGPVCHST